MIDDFQTHTTDREDPPSGLQIVVMMSESGPRRVDLPSAGTGRSWRVCVDTECGDGSTVGACVPCDG